MLRLVTTLFKTMFTCLVITLILLAVAVAALILSWRKADAATVPQTAAQSSEIILAIDQSGSMSDCEGQPGSDPQLLRQDAARLLVSYLGADSLHNSYQVGVIDFGGTTRQVAPLTDLRDEAARSDLAQRVSLPPEPIGWTDPLEALQVARQQLQQALPDRQRTVVLLTDGAPAWSGKTNHDDLRYQEQLRQEIEAYASEKITLFMVLLQGEPNQCNRNVTEYWLSIWQELADTTPQGALYQVASNADLLPTYHAIVRQMVGATDSRQLLRTQSLNALQPVDAAAAVDVSVQGVVFTILKQGDVTVTLFKPDGSPLIQGEAGVTIVETEHETIYYLAAPTPGHWTVRVEGQGEASVYQDQIALPEPPATATPMPTNTPEPTATPSATPSSTATPTLTATPTASATASETPTATATETTSPTASPTALPSHTATASPTATATASVTPTVMATAMPQASVPDRAGRSRVLWGVVLFFAMVGTGSAIQVQRSRRPYLTGELAMIAAPPDQLELAMPRDLGSKRRTTFTIGAKSKEREWQLSGWGGAAELRASRDGGVELEPVAGDVAVNSRPIMRTTRLHDGDVINCGEYQIRFDNVRLSL